MKGISESLARDVILERQCGLFTSFEDFFYRVPADAKELKALAKAGAFDQLEGANRTVLYKMQVLLRRRLAGGELDFRSSTEALRASPTLLEMHSLQEKDIPALPGHNTAHSPRMGSPYAQWPTRSPHGRTTPSSCRLGNPADRYSASVRHHASLTKKRRPPTMTAAGLVMFRQRPGTANGTMFIFLEDETGYIQCICKPDIREKLGDVLTRKRPHCEGVSCRAVGPWRGIMIEEAWGLAGVIGGYRGRPGGHTFWTGRTRHCLSSPFRIMGARNRRDPYDDNQQRQNGPNVAPSLTSKPAQTDTYVWTNRQPDAIGLPTRAV